MRLKQCKFYDKTNDVVHGGIIDDEGNIICGCCGSLIKRDDIGESDKCSYVITDVYDTWIDLDEKIILTKKGRMRLG